MASVTFEVRLDDEEGMGKVLNMISSFLNNNRVVAARARNPLPDVDETDEEEDADTVEIDATGAEWDPEKHSSKKTKLADGTWRPKRGTKSTDSKPVPPPPPAETGLAPEEIGYKEMMDKLKAKNLSLTEMNEIANQVGVSNIGLIISNPELIPAVLALAEEK